MGQKATKPDSNADEDQIPDEATARTNATRTSSYAVLGIVITFVVVLVILISLAAAGVFSSSTTPTGGTGIGSATPGAVGAGVLGNDATTTPRPPISEYSLANGSDALALVDDLVLADLVQNGLLTISGAWFNASGKTLHVLLNLKSSQFKRGDTVELDLYGGVDKRRLATSQLFTLESIGDTEIILP